MKKVAAFIFFTVFGFASAMAEDQTFRVQNKHENSVQIEFYSQSRSYAWPGSDRAYNLDDSEVHEFRLSCSSGEKICYGAWLSGNQNKYWGAGLHARQGCDSCCYTCEGSQTPIIVLNDEGGDDDD